MMNWHIALMVETQRRQEEIAEADLYRLLNSGKESILKPRPYQRWIIGLGGLMIAWGQRLQARYDRLAYEPLGLAQEQAPEPCS